MAIIKVKGIEDKNLSWGATGLLYYLMSKPENWKINLKNLSEEKKNGKDSTRNKLNELRKHGYCHYFELKENGRFKETKYLVFEVPTTPEDAQKLIKPQKGVNITYKP